MSRSHRKKNHNKYPKYKHSEIKKRNNDNNFKPRTKPLSYSLSKEITMDKTPEVKRNSFGDVIYSMQYIGYEKFEYNIEYDNLRRPLSYIDSRGCSWGCKYNNKGNISHYWDYTGYTEEYRYYANNLVICTTSFGDKIKKRIEKFDGRFITRDIFISSDDYI